MRDGPTLLLHGNFRDSSSFAIVNHHLSAGLRELGYRVTEMPLVGPPPGVKQVPAPDVYVFEGHPWDIDSAPGRINVFVLLCEYHRLESGSDALVKRVNGYFDLLVAPSRFVARIARQAGIRVPIRICPFGVDAEEFHPEVAPARLATEKTFRFLNLGGATERKGFDVLLRAYVEEFSVRDDVSLVAKVRRYELERPWAEQVLERALLGRKDAPEVLFIDQDCASIAGYYTACDAGVFPYRGEGFGMPILECVASGRPVIVTRGTGPMDFCTRENATFIRARRCVSKGRDWLEPELAGLRRAMRQAYENRAPRGSEASEIRETAAKWTWQGTVAALDARLQEHLRKPVRRVPRQAKSPVVVYGFAQRGATSWKRCVWNIDRYLAGHYPAYHAVSAKDPPPDVIPDLVVGQSEHCLETFLRAERANPAVRRIFHQETAALLSRDEVCNAERRRCGLPEIYKPPIRYWKNALECRLADRIVVASRAAARYFERETEIAKKVRVIGWGFDVRECAPRTNAKTVRFLFAGFDPVRKGVRILFEAWDRLRLPDAELWCYMQEEVLQSKLLLKYLVRNPSIVAQPPISQRRLLEIQRQVDCSVLPSLEDSFSVTIADSMGMGRPAIVSSETGISDFIENERNGWVVPTGSVSGLMRALEACYEDRARMREMGEAARETARQHPWAAFRKEFLALTDSLLPADRL